MIFAKGANFERAKSRALENVTKKISLLEKTKACISRATSKDQLKSCRKANRAAMKSFRDSNKAKHKADKIRRLEKKLEEAKKK